MTFFEIVCIGTPFPQLLLASAKGNWRYKYHKEIDKRKNKIKMTNDDEIQFVSTQKKNQQRLIYRVQKSIGCYATISTSWEVIQIIRSGEHVESCTKPDKLKQWVFVRSKREARSRIRYTLAQPEFNAEQTMTKSSQQHLIYHPPTNSILNFATKTLEDRLA
ncbi:hypothetical protein T08_14224 [Trichinella sp. T8]|nr:hypothetical protein T08_14224 [Trichinella sp. T8]